MDFSFPPILGAVQKRLGWGGGMILHFIKKGRTSPTLSIISLRHNTPISLNNIFIKNTPKTAKTAN